MSEVIDKSMQNFLKIFLKRFCKCQKQVYLCTLVRRERRAKTKKKKYHWPVRLVGLGRKVFILEIRGSNPLRATKKLNFRNGKPQIS